MNRKNTSHHWPEHPTHITVQDINSTATFKPFQTGLEGVLLTQTPQSPNKWTLPLTLQHLQPYLMGIHATLIKNLKQKILQRQLTPQQDSLIQRSRHNKHLQQFISGILAIQTCVNQLMKQHMATIVSFTKATNLVLINYKLLHKEYMEMKNVVKTSETLGCGEAEKSDGFLKFFDSLKFLALVIKNTFGESSQEARDQLDRRESSTQQNTDSSMWDSWRHQVDKLHNLMMYDSILNMDKEEIQNQHHKLLDQKLVELHNQQSQIIISQLQKENNFLRYQVYAKENTITELEESIYNVDLSGYRENEEREDYWAKRVKFSNNSNNGNSINNQNNYSQLLNDGSGITYPNKNSHNNIIEEKILESSEIYHNQELSSHLNILSKKMEQLQTENKQLREKIIQYQESLTRKDQGDFQTSQQNFPNRQNRKFSHKYQESEKISLSDRQKLDELIKEIEQMRVIIMEMEEKQNSYMGIIDERNSEITELEQVVQQMKKQVESVNQQLGAKFEQVETKNIQIQSLKKQLEANSQQIQNKRRQLQSKFLQLQQKSLQVTSLTSKLSSLQQTFSLKQQQITMLQHSMQEMDHQFTKQIEKYNEVFCNMNLQLAQSQQRVNLLQEDNLKLFERNKKLQEDVVRKEAMIVQLQTRVICGVERMGRGFNVNNAISRVENLTKYHSNGNLITNLNSINGIQANKHIYSRQTKHTRNTSQTPIKQHPHPINDLQPQPIITHHNHYHHHITQQSFTPPKVLSNQKESRSKSPLTDNKDGLKKKMTIKVEGNKLINEIVDQKSPTSTVVTNKKSQLLMKVQNSNKEKNNERQSPRSSVEKRKKLPSILSPKRQSSEPQVKTSIK